MPQILFNLPTMCRLARLSIFSMVSESSFQVALLIELALITAHVYSHDVAAYAAVSATTTFAINIFNFLLITVMAQVGKAVGQKAWNDIGARFRVALATATTLGCLVGVALFFLQDVLFSVVFRLDPRVEQSARAIYNIRLLLIPLTMIQRVCGGLLGGFQRVKVLAVRAVFIAGTEVVAQVVFLNVMGQGLVGSTWGSVVTAAIGVVLSLFLVAWYPPESAPPAFHVLLGCCDHSTPEEEAETKAEEETEEAEEADREEKQAARDKTMHAQAEVTSKTVTCDFAAASANTTVRSFLLTSSVYSMSVVAANIGTAALAAHQIAMALWMLMSLVCDGFADVATIIGSKLMGERGRSKELIVLRDILMLFGLATGAVAGTAMWFFRDSIMEIYNVNTHSSNSSSSCNSSNSSSSSSSCSNTDTTALLVMLWPLICSMQVINAAVFVLDGFVYATQSFVFIRNLMLASVLLWFFPALAIGQSMFNHSLLAVWVAKAGLNGLRCVGACWLMFVSFPKQWNRREKNVQQLLRDRLLE